jgi:S-(hydroxymethyl)glutathione dehydrogenase/alcohol dehydrogenase
VTLQTRAAVLWEPGKPWEITTLDLDEPHAGEVLIRLVASGLCHSDEHVRDGTLPSRYPIVGGHEGAGVVEAVGPEVTGLAPGDHIVCSFIPACGRCRYCSTGRQNLCDLGANAVTGCLPDGTFRFHRNGTDFGGMCMLGTFAERMVISQHSCVKVAPELPLTSAVLVGCGVPTGWGAAVNTGGVRAGDVVVVYGVGGIGSNAVQGARLSGARHVVVVDPVEFKRDAAARLGATHAVASAAEAQELVTSLTRGQGADVAIVTSSAAESDVITAGFDVIGKGGVLVLVSLGSPELNIHLSSLMMVTYEKQVRGSLFGSSNPMHDIPRMLELYEQGLVELDALITRHYTLDQVNDGYEDLLAGRNIRGVIHF